MYSKTAFVSFAVSSLLSSAAFAQSAPASSSDAPFGAIVVRDDKDAAYVPVVSGNAATLAPYSSPYVVRSPVVADDPPQSTPRVQAVQPDLNDDAGDDIQNRPYEQPDAVNGGRVDLAQTRLLSNVPNDIESYFDLFMYVSKANNGPMGQRMFVFQRDISGQLVPYAEWRVSTGREKVEFRNEKRTFTTTPEGVFLLDPDRFYKTYFSRTYDNAPMPYAMFFDMELSHGRKSGLAIHSAAGASKIARLGRRDSGGCVRLSPKNARELFYKIKNTTAGMVPVFTKNARGATDRMGEAARDSEGHLVLAEGYKALLMIEDFDGKGMVGPVVAYTH
jgi:lipoprotein-anchoring transpeptidase ErfK/SrfK